MGSSAVPTAATTPGPNRLRLSAYRIPSHCSFPTADPTDVFSNPTDTPTSAASLYRRRLWRILSSAAAQRWFPTQLTFIDPTRLGCHVPKYRDTCLPGAPGTTTDHQPLPPVNAHESTDRHPFRPRTCAGKYSAAPSYKPVYQPLCPLPSPGSPTIRHSGIELSLPTSACPAARRDTCPYAAAADRNQPVCKAFWSGATGSADSTTAGYGRWHSFPTHREHEPVPAGRLCQSHYWDGLAA